ncbi:hypothetical protein ZWY2020_052620 [Hordeum vulgare]|nr:hypothetical protein ZWY2020_052620 [Hordeum vulgare]
MAAGGASTQLSTGFYSSSCPGALGAVASVVQSAVANKPRMGDLIWLNVLCHVGILTTCFGIKQAGWLSLLLLPLLGGCSCYTGLLLKRCIDNSPTIETYPDIGRAAFGIPGRVFVSVVLYLELYVSVLSLNTGTTVFLAFTGIYLNSHNLFAISMALAILPSVWLRNLSLLSYLSAGGVVATLTVIVCLFWVGIGDGVGFHPSGSALNLTHLPVALGLYGYCFSGHLVFANIYSSMKERLQFPFVLLFCFIVVTIVYSGVAATGFLMFGESTMSQFTLSMPQQYVPSKIAIWMMIVNPYTKYALTMTLVALSIEEALPKKMQNYVAGMCVRTVLVLSTIVVALSFPYFALVMALLGSVFTMLADAAAVRSGDDAVRHWLHSVQMKSAAASPAACPGQLMVGPDATHPARPADVVGHAAGPRRRAGQQRRPPDSP